MKYINILCAGLICLLIPRNRRSSFTYMRERIFNDKHTCKFTRREIKGGQMVYRCEHKWCNVYFIQTQNKITG